MTNLVDHANRELDLAGFPKPTRAQLRGDMSKTPEDPEHRWNLMVRISVMKIVSMFSSQGHSGASAQTTIGILNQLLQFKPLSQITNNLEDWVQVDAAIAGDIEMWQCRRNPEAISHDSGKTYYFVSDYSRRGKIARHLPKSALRSWVWSHREWMHPIHTSRVVGQEN